MLLRSILVLTAALTFAASSYAATLVQTRSVSVAPELLDRRAPTGFSNTTSTTFDPFDPNLGILQSVLFEVNLSTSLELNVEVPPNRNISATGVQSVRVVFSNFFQDQALTLSLSGSGGGAGSILNDTDVAPFVASQLFTTNLGRFQGTLRPLASVRGVAALSDFVADCSGPEGGFDCAADVLTQASGDLTLTYTYVPEPSTALLVGAGLTGLALRRRKR